MHKKTLFHTFTTNEYVPWAELYIESLRLHHGKDVSIRIDALNISKENEELLKNMHSNLDLRIEKADYSLVAHQLGIKSDEFLQWKKEIEDGRVNNHNYLFKIYISVNKRYRSMQLVANEAQEKGFRYLIHSDVDVYFRSRLNNLFAIMENSDFAAFYRKSNDHTLKILGAFLVFKLNQNTHNFISEWMSQIDSVPFLKRWKGFGQSVLWTTSEKTKDKVKIANLNSEKEGPKYSKEFDNKADIWLNSNCNMHCNSMMGLPRIISWEDLKQNFPRSNNFRRHNFTIETFNNTAKVTYQLSVG